MDKSEIQKKISKGGLLAQVSFEVVGNPKEHVEKTIKEFVDNIRNDSHIHILSEDYGEAEEVENSEGLFSTFVDTEMLVESLDKFNWMCVNFMPASIEIIQPGELRIKDKDLTNWFNDLLAKLHEISIGVRQSAIKDDILVNNFNFLVQNAILLASENYHSLSDIGAKIGIGEEQLTPFINSLVKNNKLEKKGDGYYKKK